ncbi:MAG: serine/threonine-protein kinase [Planctomycetes bacterium]|nr:serine/threonine-protein kinase [Planctomycetota bacterium]
MTPERYQQVRRVFAEVCQLPVEERTGHLDRACGNDAELRAEVETLLYHDEETLPVKPRISAAQAFGRGSRGAPATPPADGAAEAPARVERIPKHIGRYRIVGKIGQGGMGAVFEAEQDYPARTIALKVIRPGIASENVLRRFKFEAQVLGRLQHPGIAQIYEADTARIETAEGFSVEQPFFAMEYVRGRPLNELVGQKNLDIRQRLELFAKICEAVQHAHQKGVIHRDLKPSNILVDNSGQPRILDFGVARITDADVQVTTLQTNLGELIGTIPYMSPEQVAGDSRELDTRSDVYALGVVLYQLLTGRLPHDLEGKTIPEAARTIVEVNPAPLSSVNRVFRGDLNTIVTKALEKDKNRRYQSASDLAADVRHYLNDEPITARPASSLYQLRKFSQRNKTLVGGILAVFVVLIVGAVVSTWEAVRAMQAERLAERRLVQMQAETEKARVINKFFNQMLVAADPGQDGRDVRVAEVLQRAAANFGVQLTDQPEIEADLQNTIGTVYVGLGLFAEAEPHLRAALDTRTRLLGDEHPDTLVTVVNLAAALKELNRPADAEQLIRRALDTRRRLFGEEHTQTLDTMNSLAGILQKQGRVAEAEALWRQTLAAQRRTLASDDPQLLITMNNLAQLLKQLRRPADAEPLLREALDLQTQVEGEEHPHTLTSMSNLAMTLKAQDKYPEAEALLRRVVAIRQRTLGEHPATYTAISNLAATLRDHGRLADAEVPTREALAGFRQTLGPENRTTLAAANNLASLQVDLGRAAEAETLYLELLKTARRILPEGHYLIRVFERNYGACLTALGRYQAAEMLLVGSYESLAASLGPTHEHTHKTLTKLIELYEAWGKPEQAAHYRAQLD